MSETLVTIAQFHGRADAAVAKHAMDSAGIDAAVENVRLAVRNEDAYRAYDALDPALPVIEEAYEERTHLVACESCGSSAIGPSPRLSTFGGIALLAIGVGAALGLTDAAFFAIGTAGLYLLMSDRRRCNDCGASWN